MHTRFLLLCTLLFWGCATTKKSTAAQGPNPLDSILRDAQLQGILAKNKVYEVQIVLTQINRDAQQVPHFTTWHYNVDSLRYFYPASTVKMPVALLALEKVNQLRQSGYPRISSSTPYELDSVRPFQRAYRTEPAAPEGKPTIAQDVRAIFAVSDNDAYNHLFDFLGRGQINAALQNKGYQNTGIMHRFYAAKRDQKLAQPFRFVDKSGRSILEEKEKEDKTVYANPNKGLQKGKGYIGSDDKLVQSPFDFSSKNWFALTDMERMLRAALFPTAMPEQARFQIAKEDLTLLHRSMGLFPREFAHPKYTETDHWDGYVKFFLYGDTKERQTGWVRSFNKVGEAYGTLTDVAYIIDPATGTEFVLAATILCNSDGIFNDDAYDYDAVGFPFLAQLGKKVLEYEQKRTKKVQPDLSYWVKVVGL